MNLSLGSQAELVITEDGKVEFFLDGMSLAVAERRGQEDYTAYYGGDFPYGKLSQHAGYVLGNVVEPIYRALQRAKKVMNG